MRCRSLQFPVWLSFLPICRGNKLVGDERVTITSIVFTKRSKSSLYSLLCGSLWHFVLCLNICCTLTPLVANYLCDCPVVATNHEQELEKVKHQPEVFCSPLLCTGRSSSWLAAHQVSRSTGRLQPIAQHRSLRLSPCR